MSEALSLPRGMRLNNPGNLRASTLPDVRTHIVDGFNRFDSLEFGVEALARLTWNYYNHIGLKTLFDFVSRYAPASENDVQSYIANVCARTRINPLSARTQDLFLDRTWNALNLMRAIVAIEQGRPPLDWPQYPEWIGPSMWVLGMSRAGGWKHV